MGQKNQILIVFLIFSVYLFSGVIAVFDSYNVSGDVAANGEFDTSAHITSMPSAQVIGSGI